jgi:hypothetical protein
MKKLTSPPACGVLGVAKDPCYRRDIVTVPTVT